MACFISDPIRQILLKDKFLPTDSSLCDYSEWKDPSGENDCLSKIQNYKGLENKRNSAYNVWLEYIHDGYEGLKSDDSQYDDIREKLISMCVQDNNEGVCDKFLKLACNSCERNFVATNSSLRRLCGCYSKSITGTVNGCDPLCNQPNVVVQRPDVTCEGGTICIIENINVSSSEDVNITQKCSHCKEGNCLCYIDKSIYEYAKNVSGGEETFNQYCGGGVGDKAFCFTVDDETGLVTQVECTSTSEDTTTTTSSSENWLSSGLKSWKIKEFYSLIIAFIVIVIIIILLVISTKGTK